MSNTTDKEIPSTGAVPKTGQNKNKRCNNKNKYCETEVGTAASDQAGSGKFRDELPLGDQAARPESPTEELRCKKRFKSVSFVLDDESTSKKSKDDPAAKKHNSRVFKNSCMKKQKKNKVSKEGGGYQTNDESEPSTSASTPAAFKKAKLTVAAKAKQDVKMNSADGYNEKDKDAPEEESNNCPQKRKKPKRSKKCIRDENNESIVKIGTESISEDELTAELENLHIQPDQNYLINLLDDMVPSCPKLRKKKRNHKLPEAAVQTDINSNVSNEFNLKKVVKWTKKRWNKDKKGASIISTQHTSVVVHNLPMAMISLYQKKLTEVFEKLGRIKRIGLAERCMETDGEVFNTTIYFETEEAATKALEEDVCFYGTAIRVSRPLPPTETIVVARSKSLLPIEELRDIFGAAGPLRCVHAGQRRSGYMALAYLEFDGPDAVERALALSGTVKVNGRPVYVNKYQVRDKDRRPGKGKRNSASPIPTV